MWQWTHGYGGRSGAGEHLNSSICTCAASAVGATISHACSRVNFNRWFCFICIRLASMIRIVCLCSYLSRAMMSIDMLLLLLLLLLLPLLLLLFIRLNLRIDHTHTLTHSLAMHSPTPLSAAGRAATVVSGGGRAGG